MSAFDLLQHPFLTMARMQGLFPPQTDESTVFLPVMFASHADVGEEGFEAMWNRHVAYQAVCLRRGETVQVRTASSLVVTVCPSDSDGGALAVGGIAICTDFLNVRAGTCQILPFRATSLPYLRPQPFVVDQLRSFYLGNEPLRVCFQTLGTNFFADPCVLSVRADFRTEQDDTLIASEAPIPWLGNGTEKVVHMPNVSARSTVRLRFYLHARNFSAPIVCMPWPLVLEILPNPQLHLPPVITGIVPLHGGPGEEMVLFGENFSSANVRVCFGEKTSLQTAYVFHSRATLIRCLIPPGSGRQRVWVFNGSVYAYAGEFRYDVDSATKKTALVD